MKIGRNAPCPCGSGKKYKKCCLGKENNPDYSIPENISVIYKQLRKSAQFKECLYPDHSRCSEKIIKAHSIQNNTILSKISDNGKVYMPGDSYDKNAGCMTPSTFLPMVTWWLSLCATVKACARNLPPGTKLYRHRYDIAVKNSIKCANKYIKITNVDLGA